VGPNTPSPQAMSETRKLAAILAADVVGFSRLAATDEEDTLTRLRSLRSGLIEPSVANFRGRIVKWTGDGAIAEFRSAVDAVRCAIAIQEGAVSRNADLPSERRIVFRIGVHVGDVVEEIDGDLMGDGINVAARLEAIAEPNRIVLSEDTYRQVRGRIDVAFIDLGERPLKNISYPVRVYQHDMDATPSAPDTWRPALPLPDRPSIAVLPFRNISGDPEQEYFVDGMVEEIITGLARIRWLFVIARNSSYVYKGRTVDVRQVGRDLGVRYLLEGSVRKAGNRVRVTGELVEAESGRHIWAERYDRTLEDIFSLQDELTTSVVAAIEPSLRQAEVERVKHKRPDHLDAYDLLLRALPDIYPAMPEGALKALPLLECALNLEPDYALAHGYAAWCHEILFVRGGAREENRLGGIHHAEAAIQHGRDDANALALGGFVMGLVGHDREAARPAFDAALALSPSCAFAFLFGSVVLATGGDADWGVKWGESALRLSPLDPGNYGPYFAITLGRLQRGDYVAAAEAARKCFQANPNWSYTHMLLAATHAKLGRTDEATSSAQRVVELQPGYSITGMCDALGLHASIAELLSEALCVAGLPMKSNCADIRFQRALRVPNDK
jgi:adenylate cyclase